ncbi:hypothetical protein Aperf_G00000113789 [Anoplocephala perfoliata]
MNDALQELRLIRENNLRDSAKVVNIWSSSIQPQLYRLGREKWIVLEQVLVAALDVHALETAQTCLNHLQKQFPESIRVKRLQGMCLEALNQIDEARALYSEILDKESVDIISRKRLITTFKSQGLYNQAIDELNKYLKLFMADVEAWSELSDLYLAQGDFKHAAFCIEEVILANPHNHLLHERLAEIKYSEGGTENLELARAYFAHACRLNPMNVRALYGLLLAASNLSGKISEKALAALTEENSSTSAQQQYSLAQSTSSRVGANSFDSKRENHQLILWAVEKLKKIYAEAGLMAPVTVISSNVKGNTGLISAKSRQKSETGGLCETLERLTVAPDGSPRRRNQH